MFKHSTAGQRAGGTWQAAPCFTFTLLILAAITASPLGPAEAAGDSSARFSRFARRVIQAAAISDFEVQQRQDSACAAAPGSDPEDWQRVEEAARQAISAESAARLSDAPALDVSVIRGP